jgi:hypothetical protein
MEKIIYFLFLISFSIYSQQYDYQSKSEINIDASIDISKAIQITNLDEIYSQQGLHYIGYGYYTSVGINQDKTTAYSIAYNKMNMNYCKAKEETKSERTFYQNGKRYYFYRYTWRRVSDWNHYPVMKKSEYLETIRKNKELLEYGLMEQPQYDKELAQIKHNIKYRKFNSPYSSY